MQPPVCFVAIIGGMQMFGMLCVFIGSILAAMSLSMLRVWTVIKDRVGMATIADQKKHRRRVMPLM